LFDRLGIYDTSYRSAADFELLLRARGTLKAAFMPLTTAMMRAGGISDNSAALAEAYRAKRHSGGSSAFRATLDLWDATLRFKLGPARRAWGRLLAR
jgi:hypothetical protein